MAKITMVEQEEFPTLPADSILHLKVDDLEVEERQGRYGAFEKLDVKFKILGIQAIGDGSDPSRFDSLIGGPIFGSVPFRLTDSPENRLRLWVEAILGMEIGVGFELDTDLLKNRECRGVTINYDKRTTDPRTGKPFQGMKVDSLLPKGNSLQQAQPQAQPQIQQPTPQERFAQAQPQPQAQPQTPAQPQQQFQPAGVWDDPPFRRGFSAGSPTANEPAQV